MHAARHVFLAAALLGALAGIAQADTLVPKQDLKGLVDPAGLKRFSGAVLVYRDDVAYDEVKLPIAKAVYKDEKVTAARSLDRAGQRTALQYITPPDRSALEVLRNYQQEQRGAGFETVFECAGEACGDSRDIDKTSLSALVLPDTWWTKAGDNSPAACGGGHFVSDFRYAVLDNKASGASIALMVWKPGDVSVYCDEKEFKKRISVLVVKVEPKAREQKMETLSASELGKSLDANGKVAVYGILFDTGKADIKPESKASLDQIGALLKQQAALKLHVVGHTDNAGALPANLDLSKRRADAVSAALAKDYGIARDRLTANGVGSLAPVASNASDAGKAKNRRVELVLQ